MLQHVAFKSGQVNTKALFEDLSWEPTQLGVISLLHAYSSATSKPCLYLMLKEGGLGSERKERGRGGGGQ